MCVNAISLVAACLDVPIEDTSSAAVTILRNFSIANTLSTLFFPDPATCYAL